MATTFAPAPFATPVKATEAQAAPAVVEEAPTEPDYRSIYLSSILAVSVLFLFGVGVPTWLFLDDPAGGFALGAMCAIWGGPSFGVMTGSARVSAWQEAHGTDH